jgi:hypothetical protein
MDLVLPDTFQKSREINLNSLSPTGITFDYKIRFLCETLKDDIEFIQCPILYISGDSYNNNSTKHLLNIINSYFFNELNILEYTEKNNTKPEKSTIFITGYINEISHIEKFKRYIILSDNDNIWKKLDITNNHNYTYSKILKLTNSHNKLLYCVKNI